MALTQQVIEEIGKWCLDSIELAVQRREAKRLFFGEDDPRPIKYWPGAEERVGRERRFLGWFMFDFILPDGARPAEVAVQRLYTGSLQSELLRAVSRTRFILAVLTTTIQRSVYLELEDETFEVRSPIWAASVSPRQALLAHIVPERRGYWLPGPGWLVWPIGLGPGIRASLKKWQMDPVTAERFVQGRVSSEGDKPRPEPVSDTSLEDAVARMTAWATERAHPSLALPVDAWQAMVIKHLDNPEVTGFIKEVFDKLGVAGSEEEVQEMLGLSMNIWNNTPQPDRGGLSANQLVERYRKSSPRSPGN